MRKEPVIGQEIYVKSAFFVYRGIGDFCGGLATINRIEHSDHLPKGHCNYTMVGISERPGVLYNWKGLMESQEELEKTYEGKFAHLDPDYSEDCNPHPNADWK